MASPASSASKKFNLMTNISPSNKFQSLFGYQQQPTKVQQSHGSNEKNAEGLDIFPRVQTLDDEYRGLQDFHLQSEDGILDGNEAEDKSYLVKSYFEIRVILGGFYD